MSLGIVADGMCGDGWNGVQGTVKGLLYGAPSQLAAEAIGVITNFVVGFTLSYVFFKILDAIMGMKVSPEVEMQGLDVPEMGAEGYAGYTDYYPQPVASTMGYPLISMSKEKAEAVGKAFLETGKEKR